MLMLLKIHSMRMPNYGFQQNEITVAAGQSASRMQRQRRSLSRLETSKVQATSPRNPALAIGLLQKRDSKCFTLDIPGVWRLENMYQPNQNAFLGITVRARS